MPSVVITDNNVLFVKATSAQFTQLTPKDVNTIYFLTDSHEIYVGDQLYSGSKVEFTSTVPEFDTAESEKLYVVSDGSGNVTFYVKGSDSMLPAGGSGDISIEDLSDILETGSSGDNTKIPTSGAVDEKIATALAGFKGAIVDVSADRSEDNSGTVITFTPKEGEPKSVTIADLFLSAASYDAGSHELTLTVTGAEEPVKVNLEDLIPQAVSTSDVAMASNIVCTVDVGNFHSGDTIDISDVTNLQKFLVAMLSQDRNPITTQPSASITLTNSGAKEVGTQFTPQYSANLNPGSYSATAEGAQPTGVTATSWNVTDTNSGSASTQTGSFSAFTIEDGTNYRVSVTVQHSAGAVPKTFLGEEYPEGQIQAGSKSAQSATVTGYRNCFWGYKNGSNTIADPTAITAAEIKALGNANRTKPNSLVTSQMQQMFFALPAGQVTGLSIQASTGLPQTVQGPVTVQVGGVSDYSPTNYDVFYVSNAIAEAGSETYTLSWTN